MGYKKIRAEYDAAKKEIDDTVGAFLREAREINTRLSQFRKKYDQAQQVVATLSQAAFQDVQKARALRTHGIVQLDEMKRVIVNGAEAWMQQGVNLTEIERLHRALGAEIEQMLKDRIEQYIARLEASWPKEIKPGMTFRKSLNGREILIGEVTEVIPGKSGAAPSYKLKVSKGYWGQDERMAERTEHDLSARNGYKLLKA